MDKDRASALLARELEADLFIMATDADAVYLDWGKPTPARHPAGLARRPRSSGFAAGSMGPKVEAAVEFVQRTGKTAAIGALADLERIASGEAGTMVTPRGRGGGAVPVGCRAEASSAPTHGKSGLPE